MTAVAVERAARTLARREGRRRSGLLLAVGAALLAGPAVLVSPSLGAALLAGSAVQTLLCAVERIRLRDLVAGLALEPAAYAIPAVREYGARLQAQRTRFGLWLVEVVDRAGEPETMYLPDRVARYRAELCAAASELMAPDARVEPVSVATCRRLLTMAAESPLYNPNLPAVDLGSALFRIRAGIVSDPARVQVG
ncbi:MAG: hypothetical protein QOH46_4075 [Solirubrobacteraceae bacterium]|jgi:hypothetical protein|nr:hypothetical protein [Solirubrobacteraceae bacterium]